MSVLHLSGVVQRTRELRCSFVDLFCSRRAALKRLPTQGAAKKLAGLRSQPVECLAGRHRVLRKAPSCQVPGAAGTAYLTGTHPPEAASAPVNGQWRVGARAPPRLEPAPKARTA